MRTLKQWYIIVAVLVFTFCVSIGGRTPAGWGLHGLSLLVHAAPSIGTSLPTQADFGSAQ